jgi:hypothetical protein
MWICPDCHVKEFGVNMTLTHADVSHGRCETCGKFKICTNCKGHEVQSPCNKILSTELCPQERGHDGLCGPIKEPKSPHPQATEEAEDPPELPLDRAILQAHEHARSLLLPPPEPHPDHDSPQTTPSPHPEKAPE